MYKEAFRQEVYGLQSLLGDEYTVRIYSFGDRVREGFTGNYRDRETDIGQFFSEINNLYENRNLGALLLASDGLWNRGEDPIRVSEKFRFPLYSIILGDTSIKKDLLIRNIIHNRTVCLGDQFPVEIETVMNMMPASSSVLTVNKDGKSVFSKTIFARGNLSVERTTLWLDADVKGVQRYSATFETIPGEFTTENNHRNFIVEVLEKRQRILLLYEAPHPDIAAFSEALSGSNRFEVESRSFSNLPRIWTGYSLIVLHQMPTMNSATVTRDLLIHGIPVLFVLGSQTNIPSFNQLKCGLIIDSDREVCSEALPLFNPSFSLFTIRDDYKRVIEGYPPLVSPFGTYRPTHLTDVLFYQQIGNVQTEVPLIMFSRNADLKTGIITGENLWKWRIQEAMTDGSTKVFDELISHIAQYLTLDEDRSYFRVRVEPTLNELEHVVFEAELYNKTYEAVNETDVNIVIRDEQNNSFPLVFGRNGKTYLLNAGFFPPGSYTYTATVKLGSDLYSKTGAFEVSQLEKEGVNLVADLRLMNRLSKLHDGFTVFPGELARISDSVRHREDIVSSSSMRKSYHDLAGTPWFFLLIIALLTAEWIVRKRQGEP